MTLRVIGVGSNGPARWLVAPVGALLAAAVTKVCRSVAEPGMPRMSSEWLLSHEQLVGRRTGN
jgi:hypothetical protein